MFFISTKKATSTNSGFTLVELIVVIAIIGLLASLVLVGLDVARNKARDASVLSSVSEMRSTLEQEYLAGKSYSNLLGSPNWKATAADCTSGFSGQYASNTIAICQKIMANSLVVGGFPGALWIGPGASGDKSKYTIMVYLPGQKKYYCVGFDEQKSTLEPIGGTATLWSSPGCWNNY